MHSHACHHRSICALGLSLAALAHAPAQTAATADPASPAATPPIELSPFVVDDTRDVGYLATNTLAGSRFNTALKDTPAAISVLTAEFLSDLGAFELEEALPYAVNLEFALDDDREAINGNATIQGYQSYRVRGLDATVSRNYFAWTGPAVPSESAFVERIEDSRGPNSVLFGVASPGGLINVNTKQARFGRAFQEGSFTIGSYNSRRATVDLNHPLGRLAIRLNLVYNKANSFRHWEHQEHQRAHLAAKYKLGERTSLRAEFERGQLETNKGRSFNLLNRFLLWDSVGRPVLSNPVANAALGIGRNATAAAQVRVTHIANNNMAISMRGAMNTTGAVPAGEQFPGVGATDGLITDRRIADYSINIGGAAQNRYSRYGIFAAFLEHQFGKNTFLELGYQHLEHSFDNRDPRQDAANALKGDPNALLNDGTRNPFAGQAYLETNWFRTVRWDQGDVGRLTLSHELDAGKWGKYRFATLGEYEKGFFLTRTYREFWVDSATGLPAFNTATPENAVNNVWRRNYVTEFDWPSYHISGPEGSGGLLANVFDPVTGRTLSSAWYPQQIPNESHYTQKAGMLVMQGRHFDGRLITTLGLRRDEVDFVRLGSNRDSVTQFHSIDRSAPPRAVDNAVGRTKTLGLVYHVRPWISLIYNRADNISLPQSGQTILPASGEPGRDNLPIPPPPKGKGEDFGLGLDLLEGRIYAKATYYTTAGKDQSTTSPARVRNSANAPIMDALLAQGYITPDEHSKRMGLGSHALFAYKSEGYEFQVTANPTKTWRFTGSLAETDAVEDNKFPEWKSWEVLTTQFLSQFDVRNIVTDSGATIAELITLYQDELRVQTQSDGIGKLGNRRYKVNLATRYDFPSGRLGGLYVWGGYRHQSKMYTGLDAAMNKVYTNSFWNADAMIGYKVRGLRKGRNLTFQLNIYNVFNKREPLVTRLEPDRVTVFREVVQPPTTWKFTTSFEY